jgi:uncharacterized membrane protein
VTAPPRDTSPDATAAASIEAELVAAERMIFFADAVVAIAITLLAIGLPLPHGVSNGQVLRSLWDHRAEYLAFLISFVVIGNYWAAHRRLFQYVVRLGGHVTGLNMAWLLMMVITPFATRVLSGDGGFAVRFTFYALVQVTAAVCLLLMARAVAYRQTALRGPRWRIRLARRSLEGRDQLLAQAGICQHQDLVAGLQPGVALDGQ